MAKKRELEILLSKVKPHPSPKPLMEQYATPPQTAATLLYVAAYTFKDIVGRKVCDLGCGSGGLAIGAAYLGAELVVGIDVDRLAISTARMNAKEAGLDVEWVVGDVDLLRGRFDTAVENPPFGVRKRGADVRFLKKALSMANVVYSIHKDGEKGRSFIRGVAEETGSSITNVMQTSLTIPHQFNFHRKPIYRVRVNIYRVVSGMFDGTA